jgi:hypothetical protein
MMHKKPTRGTEFVMHSIIQVDVELEMKSSVVVKKVAAAKNVNIRFVA